MDVFIHRHNNIQFHSIHTTRKDESYLLVLTYLSFQCIRIQFSLAFFSIIRSEVANSNKSFWSFILWIRKTLENKNRSSCTPSPALQVLSDLANLNCHCSYTYCNLSRGIDISTPKKLNSMFSSVKSRCFHAP